MGNTDAYYIEEIRAGGARQEKAIRLLYEQFFTLVKNGQQKYRPLDEDEVTSAYNAAVISLRKELVTGNFRGDSSLSTFLNRIFTNKCIDLLRQKNAHSTEPLESAPETDGEGRNPLMDLMQADQIERVFHAMNILGEPCKQILMDSEYWGYSADEIAHRIGFKNAASVNSKKYTCLQQLREMLGGRN